MPTLARKVTQEGAPPLAATFDVVRADNPALVAQARLLIEEYAVSLGIDLEFQEFEHELADLTSAYPLPSGCLVLARRDQRPLGCVAIRPLEPGVCEMKRLYVRPEARGQGVGRRLAEAAIGFGREAGYRAMRLDTLPSMADARRLYTALGFQEIPPYRFNPIRGTTFLELGLRSPPD